MSPVKAGRLFVYISSLNLGAAHLCAFIMYRSLAPFNRFATFFNYFAIGHLMSHTCTLCGITIA